MILGTVLLTASALAASPASGDTVAYSVAPAMTDGTLTALAVRLDFVGDADGETRLLLPREWAGSDELWRDIEELTADGAAEVRDLGSGEHLLRHVPGARLSVRYRVRSAQAAEPGFSYEKARPLVLPGWFFFHGEGVFAIPDGRAEAPARFAWQGFPASWTLASDLDHLAGTRGATVNDVVESVAIGAPDLVVFTHEIDAAPLRVAIRGSWRFAPEDLADAILRIVVAANELWGDRGRAFLVPLAPLGGGDTGVSAHGTGRGDAFSIASTPGLELAGATRLLAHEYLHSWNPRELGGLPKRDEALGYWFTEGFTDFLAPRVLLRAGLWSPADVAAELNRTLLRYATSPVREATAAEILASFWTDRDVAQLPYDRGHLLAHLLDHRLRQSPARHSGLLAVLHEQREHARANISRGERASAQELFLATLRTAAGIDARGEVARHIERGEPIRLPADLFAPCAEVVTLTQPEFDRGFDLRATEDAGGILTGVDPTGPAYAAGMRDGMRVIRRVAGEPGDASVEVAYRIEHEGIEQVVRYLPAGRGEVTLQRVVLERGATEADCLRMLGARKPLRGFTGYLVPR